MIDSECKQLAEYFGNAFDIPFSVSKGAEKGDMFFYVTPISDFEPDTLFVMKVAFVNHVRIIITIEGQRYSKWFINSLGKASDLKKQYFSEYYQQLNNRNAQFKMLINNTIVDCSDPSSWETNWSSFSIRITKSPIVETTDSFSKLEFVEEWGTLALGMILSLADIVEVYSADTVEENSEDWDYSSFEEGKKTYGITTRYEHNPHNRQLCLAANGFRCKVCGIDFSEKYGPYGKGFIHVHHIIPVSTYGGPVKLNPTKDLIPICPNCHYMLHRHKKTLLPDELKQMLKK